MTLADPVRPPEAPEAPTVPSVNTHDAMSEVLAELFAPDTWRPEPGTVGEAISAAWREHCGSTFAALVAALDIIDQQPGEYDHVTRIIREQEASRERGARAARRGLRRRWSNRAGPWRRKAA